MAYCVMSLLLCDRRVACHHSDGRASPESTGRAGEVHAARLVTDARLERRARAAAALADPGEHPRRHPPRSASGRPSPVHAARRPGDTEPDELPHLSRRRPLVPRTPGGPARLPGSSSAPTWRPPAHPHPTTSFSGDYVLARGRIHRRRTHSREKGVLDTRRRVAAGGGGGVACGPGDIHRRDGRSGRRCASAATLVVCHDAPVLASRPTSPCPR